MAIKKQRRIVQPSTHAGGAGSLAALVPMLPPNVQPWIAGAAFLWGTVGPYIAAKVREQG